MTELKNKAKQEIEMIRKKNKKKKVADKNGEENTVSAKERLNIARKFLSKKYDE